MGDDSVLEMNQSVIDLFPEEAWQRGLCKQLQTAGRHVVVPVLGAS